MTSKNENKAKDKDNDSYVVSAIPLLQALGNGAAGLPTIADIINNHAGRGFALQQVVEITGGPQPALLVISVNLDLTVSGIREGVALGTLDAAETAGIDLAPQIAEGSGEGAGRTQLEMDELIRKANNEQAAKSLGTPEVVGGSDDSDDGDDGDGGNYDDTYDDGDGDDGDDS